MTDSFDARLEAAGLIPVDDNARQSAYDALPADRRGWLKLTLALAEAVYGQRGEHWTGTSRPELGFSHSLRLTPAHWTLCALSRDFAAAPRLAAAIMTARLAGQNTVLVVWEGEPQAPALLTVLDLTGVDSVFFAPALDWKGLIRALRDEYGPEGRALLFGVRAELAVPCWCDVAPALTVGAEADAAIVRWAHPDASFHNPDHPDLTAAYGSGSAAGLRFGPGLDGCWLCPGLDPGFFMTGRRELYRLG